MDVIVPLALLSAVLGLTFTRALRSRRGPRTSRPGDDPRVTLAVVSGGTAIVTVGTEAERSPGAAQLVDEAVQDALAFHGVDSVEVRRADGELLERRLRPTHE